MEINFQLNPYVRRDGRQMIMLRYSHAGKPVLFSTGERVHAKNWDDRRKRVRKLANDRHIDINNELQALSDEIEDIARYLKRTERIPPYSHLVKGEYEKRKNLQIGLDFWGYWDLYREETDYRRKSGTKRNLESIKRVFLAFEKEDRYHFSFLNTGVGFYNRFHKWNKERGNSPYYVEVRLTAFRSFLNHAHKKGWCNTKPWEDWPKGVQAPRGKNTRDLTAKEVALLESLPPLADKDQKILDKFLLLTYTGLRFSDSNKGNYEIIQEPEFNVLQYINNKASRDEGINISNKSKFNLKVDEIPIISKAQVILDKYNGFPVATNQDANNQIKLIALAAGIQNPHKLTMRTARKTFATLLDVYEAPDELISIGLSHSQKKGLLSTYTNQGRKRNERLRGLFDFLTLAFGHAD